jgi:hypothetical protein
MFLASSESDEEVVVNEDYSLEEEVVDNQEEDNAEESDVIHSDGTFATVPNNSFYQIYSLHGKLTSELSGDVLMPMAFFLLPDKTADTYTKTFRLVKEVLPGLEISPKNFVKDFEAAAIKAIRAIFPFCLIILCFFHFSQSINRHIIQNGLAKSYRDEEENRILINKLKGLAMAHPDVVIDYFVELGSIEWGEFQSIYNYFEDTYIGRLTQVSKKARPGQRKQAPVTVRGKERLIPSKTLESTHKDLGRPSTNKQLC